MACLQILTSQYNIYIYHNILCHLRKLNRNCPVSRERSKKSSGMYFTACSHGTQNNYTLSWSPTRRNCWNWRPRNVYWAKSNTTCCSLPANRPTLRSSIRPCWESSCGVFADSRLTVIILIILDFYVFVSSASVFLIFMPILASNNSQLLLISKRLWTNSIVKKQKKRRFKMHIQVCLSFLKFLTFWASSWFFYHRVTKRIVNVND